MTPKQKARKWMLRQAAKFITILAIFCTWIMAFLTLSNTGHGILAALVWFFPIGLVLIGIVAVVYQSKVEELEKEDDTKG